MSNHTIALTISSKAFVFDTGVLFRGLTISENGKGFNIVLRGLRKDGTPVYAMTQHEDPQTGLEILYKCLVGRQGETFWRFDRYAAEKAR